MSFQDNYGWYMFHNKLLMRPDPRGCCYRPSSPREASRNTFYHMLHPVYLGHQKKPKSPSHHLSLVPLQLCTALHWLKLSTVPEPHILPWASLHADVRFNSIFSLRPSPPLCLTLPSSSHFYPLTLLYISPVHFY